ncbi:MAG: P-II family nitrogen regulator [Tissierellia bacterium]|nr:P-II family nitrogen regulator [Tissierellia bacterium]
MDEIKCIIAIVERGKADKVVNKAKKAGAKGATILYGRGTGQTEALKFFNIYIEASKEIIIILSEEDKYEPIYEAIVEAGRLKEPGTGIVFTVPANNLIGLHHRGQLKG